MTTYQEGAVGGRLKVSILYSGGQLCVSMVINLSKRETGS